MSWQRNTIKKQLGVHDAARIIKKEQCRDITQKSNEIYLYKLR